MSINVEVSKIIFSYNINKETYNLSQDQLLDENCQIHLHQIPTHSGIRLILKLDTTKPIEIQKLQLHIPIDYEISKGVFCNGYQSWTETKIFSPSTILKSIRYGFGFLAKSFGDYNLVPYTKQKGVVHAWTYSYIKQSKKQIYFIGSLDERNGFTAIQHFQNQNYLIIDKQLEGKLYSEDAVLLDVYIDENAEYIAFDHYFLLQNIKHQNKLKPAIGWTSWYHYYTKIDEKILLDNLEAFANNNIPLEIFQIDDGYQQALGDWLLINNKFPNGMKYIADAIHQRGFKAGIWLAPFSAEKKSKLFQEHPDWFRKNEKGSFLQQGFNPLWSGWFYALDIYNSDFRSYLKKVFDTILLDWGFDMVKLDFLYGIALLPYNGKSRGEVMYDGMVLLRELIGDKLILGCGVPLASSFGLVDYCRIGQDVHLSWEHSFLKWIRGRERVSTFLALQNTIQRRHLDTKYFINDPDVFILREEKQSLTKSERYTLLNVNLLFGNLLFTSDNIANYNIETLELYKSIFPLFDKINLEVEQDESIYMVRFSIRERHYLSIINLGNQLKYVKLPKGMYFDSNSNDIVMGETQIDIQYHQSYLFYDIGFSPFALLGTIGHFFPCAEIKELWMEDNSLKYTLIENLLITPKVFFKVPKDYLINDVNGKPFDRIEKKDFSIIATK